MRNSLMNTAVLLAFGLGMMPSPAADESASIEAKTRIHRLKTTHRSTFDAFVYVNRVPDKPDKGERPADFAGRIFGRLAYQEGRVVLKLPPGMDRKAYLGFKTFLGSEGDARVSNCVSCHAPPEFTDAMPHVTVKGKVATVTPSLRNSGGHNIDLAKVIREKIAMSTLKRSGDADDIDDAYAAMTITEADVPYLVAFLHTLNDVPDAEFRDRILHESVLDTSDDIEGIPTVSGGVRFDGPRPKRQRLPMDAASLKLHESWPLDESVLVGKDGGLANVFVQVKKGLEKKNYPVPEQPVSLNQVGSIFRPRVQGIMIDQELLLRNSDPYLHNVRSLSLKNRAFNIAQPPGTPARKRVFKRKEGPIRMGCDFHRWMKAYVFVMDHPFFAVTDKHGRFEIAGLPPGNYTLEAWHEAFGKQRAEIAVGGSGAAKVNFTFRPKQE